MSLAIDDGEIGSTSSTTSHIHAQKLILQKKLRRKEKERRKKIKLGMGWIRAR